MILKQILYLIISLTFIFTYPVLADSMAKNDLTHSASKPVITKIDNKGLSDNLQNKTNSKESKLNKSDKSIGGAAPVEKKSELKSNTDFIKKYYLNNKTNLMNIIKIVSSVILICGLFFWIFLLISWALKKGNKLNPVGLAATAASAQPQNNNEDISYSVSSFIKHRIHKKM
jgi:hypothetical protein